MMKRYRLILLRRLIILFILSACTSSSRGAAPTPTLMVPNEFTRNYEPLSSEIAGALSEERVLGSTSFSSRLLEVGYIDKDNIIVGVYSDKGNVVGWIVDTGVIAFNHEFGIVSSKALALIASGNNIIGATEHIFKIDRLNRNVEYVNGIALWDVHTGSLIKCISFPCQGTSNQRDGFLGLAVDSRGEQLAIYSEMGIDLSSLLADSPNLYFTINADDASYPWQIGSVAFDERNHRYAVVFQEGRIYIFEDENSINYRMIANGSKGDINIVTDTQIDPTGRWLVVARGDKTSVLNLDNGKVLLETELTNPVLAFDQTGDLLFVGSASRLAIYSLEQASKISEYDTPGIAALALSEDNRLVIWGDTQGKIHIWGKPAHQP